MKKLLYSLTAILFSLTTFTACSSSSDDGPTPPPTIDDVQTGIIGKWASPEMELIFRANNTMHIKHGELRRDIDGGEFYVNERDYTTTYTISESEDLVEIFFNGEYMYIHKLANGILSIELYGEDIFFTLAKTNDDTEDEDDENILIEECGDCDGNGYTEDYSYQCLVCGGMWKSECDKCWGDGLLDYDETTGKNTTCNNCSGSGYIVCWHCNGPSKITCKTCEGSGKGRKWCTTCYGKGKVRE